MFQMDNKLEKKDIKKLERDSDERETKKKYSNFFITEILNDNEKNENKDDEEELNKEGNEQINNVRSEGKGVKSDQKVLEASMQASKSTFDAANINRWLLWYRQQLQLQLSHRLAPHYRSNGQF